MGEEYVLGAIAPKNDTRAGFDPGRVDGRFGRKTQAAVVAFQRGHELVADGEVGPQTAKALGIKLPTP